MPIRSILVLLIFLLGLYCTHTNWYLLDRTWQLARELGLAESVVHKAERQSQPALHLEHASGEHASWLGGAPAVPAGFKWPYWRDRPLSFLVQLDLAEVSAVRKPSWLPQRGQLYFFFIGDESATGYEAADRGAWRVFYSDVEHSMLTVLDPPTTLDPALRFPKVSLTMRPIASLPSEERLMGRWEISPEEDVALYDAQNSLFRQQPRHQLLGLPVPEQDDDMEVDCQLAANGIRVGRATALHDRRLAKVLAGTKEWHLLLQIDTDDVGNMMWGDGGLLYFWIREADAAKRDFSNVWMILQSG